MKFKDKAYKMSAGSLSEVPDDAYVLVAAYCFLPKGVKPIEWLQSTEFKTNKGTRVRIDSFCVAGPTVESLTECSKLELDSMTKVAKEVL